MKTSEDLDRALLGEKAADGLRQLILSGDLPPGSRIFQEELAERFGASRIPVREALRQLESEGLVTLAPNRGAWVARLDLGDCLESYRIRERIEPLALEQSVLHMTAEDIGLIEDLAKRTEQTRDKDEFLALDRAFHLASYRAAGMPQLMALVERYWNTTQQYRRAYISLIWPTELWVTYYEHRLLVEAAKRRDSEEAGRILYGHIRRTRLELERHLEIFSA